MNKLLVIAGFARCGTTWLHNRLAQHSRIRSALGDAKAMGVKEIGYFEFAHRDELNRLSEARAWGDRVDRANRARFPHLLQRRQKLQERVSTAPPRQQAVLHEQIDSISRFVDHFGESDAWYSNLFRTGPDDWAIDSTPSYSRLPDRAIAHIGSIAETVRVVLIVREPASRLRSIVQHNAHNGKWLARSSTSIEQMIATWEDPYQGRIEAFRQSLKPGQLSIFFFEDLIRDRGRDTSALLSEIGLPLEEQVFVKQPAPNPSGELAFDRAAYLALADHSERVSARAREYLGSVPPEWEQAPAKFRAEADTLGSGAGLAKKASSTPKNRALLLDEIDRLKRGQRTTELLERLSLLLSAYGEDRVVRLMRAEALERLGSFEQALKDYRRASRKGDITLVADASGRIDTAQKALASAAAQLDAGNARAVIDVLGRVSEDTGAVPRLFELAKAHMMMSDKKAAGASLSLLLCEAPAHAGAQKLWTEAFR